MKKTFLFIFAAFIWIAGCPQSIPLADTTDVPCAGAHNDGQPAFCSSYVASGPGFISTAYAAQTIVEIGTISRGTMVIGEGVVDNPLADDFYGWAEFVIVDGGCNGASKWEIMPKQPVFVAAGNIRDVVGAGGQCGDMALGPHTAIATVWDAGGVVTIGKVIIHFNLVE